MSIAVKVRKRELVRMAAQHSVQLTVGTHCVFLAFFVALSIFCFDGASTLPPTAANASRWLATHRKACKWINYSSSF